jgi:hypothetical protein
MNQIKRCTKACSHIVRNENGFSKCPRQSCSFAHYMEELVIVECLNGVGCTYRNCRFQHPGESIDDYYTRTGFTRPHLPYRSPKTQPVTVPLEESDDVWLTIIKDGLSRNINTFTFQ